MQKLYISSFAKLDKDLLFFGIQVNDVVAAGQELDEEMMSKLSNMKVSKIKLSNKNVSKSSIWPYRHIMESSMWCGVMQKRFILFKSSKESIKQGHSLSSSIKSSMRSYHLLTLSTLSLDIIIIK